MKYNENNPVDIAIEIVNEPVKGVKVIEGVAGADPGYPIHSFIDTLKPYHETGTETDTPFTDTQRAKILRTKVRLSIFGAGKLANSTPDALVTAHASLASYIAKEYKDTQVTRRAAMDGLNPKTYGMLFEGLAYEFALEYAYLCDVLGFIVLRDGYYKWRGLLSKTSDLDKSDGSLYQLYQDLDLKNAIARIEKILMNEFMPDEYTFDKYAKLYRNAVWMTKQQYFPGSIGITEVEVPYISNGNFTVDATHWIAEGYKKDETNGPDVATNIRTQIASSGLYLNEGDSNYISLHDETFTPAELAAAIETALTAFVANEGHSIVRSYYRGLEAKAGRNYKIKQDAHLPAGDYEISASLFAREAIQFAPQVRLSDAGNTYAQMSPGSDESNFYVLFGAYVPKYSFGDLWAMGF